MSSRASKAPLFNVAAAAAVVVVVVVVVVLSWLAGWLAGQMPDYKDHSPSVFSNLMSSRRASEPQCFSLALTNQNNAG